MKAVFEVKMVNGDTFFILIEDTDGANLRVGTTMNSLKAALAGSSGRTMLASESATDNIPVYINPTKIVSFKAL